MPNRVYEPNIVSNPLTHFGIWTPRGWRVHAKRWGSARRRTIHLSGDGQRTVFPGALLDPLTGRVEWSDDLHLRDDPFTDGGIYPSDPRVEYPPGRPRWAVSHTLLCYLSADHGLFTHEYTWALESGTLTTYFRERTIQRARTNATDGRTVGVAGPISTTIEGNVEYGTPCSAVRGVWTTADRRGRNLYTSRVSRVLEFHNGVYGTVDDGPVIDVHGIYLPDAPLDVGVIADHLPLGKRLAIPLDVPKLAMIRPPYRKVWSECYQTEVSLPATTHAVVNDSLVDAIRAKRGAWFAEGRVGFAQERAVGRDALGYAGYEPALDLNSDGVIDERDEQLAAAHVGRRVLLNQYLGAYFGGDWLQNTRQASA